MEKLEGKTEIRIKFPSASSGTSMLNQLYTILVISDYRSVNAARPEAEVFIQLAALGHQVTILSYPEATYYNDRFRKAGIEIIEQHPVKKFSLSFISFLRKLVKEKKFDFVHAFNSQGLVNCVWGLQGLPAKLIAYRGYAGQTHWYDPMMYTKYFHPRVDHIICLSDEIREILAVNMPWAKHKLTTIHKGHDPAWYAQIEKYNRADFGFTDNDVLLCFVANVRPFKGLPYLLKATQQLSTNLPLHFLFIGNGYEDAEIQSLISQSPFKDRIHLLGFRKDALSIVAMSDGLVLTSTHGEALTKSVLEAMSLGIPPVITDIAGNKGVVIDGDSGWIVPAKDVSALAKAIEELALNPEERKRRGRKAKEHMASHFHTKNTVEGFLSMYGYAPNP